MGPHETQMTVCRITQHSIELRKLTNQLMEQPDFKTDVRLAEKQKELLRALDEFDDELANRD